MRKKLTYEKVAEIAAGLLTGKSATEVAEDVGISGNIVRQVRRDMEKNGVKFKGHVPQLVTRALVSQLQSLERLTDRTKDEEWLKKQSGHDIAALHAVTADRAFRILDSIENATVKRGEAEIKNQELRITN
jgi:transposase